jgi:HAD domain in Swiss Army Knife RNA repair proteins
MQPSVQSKDHRARGDEHKPVLMVDIDGVLSLFGAGHGAEGPDGQARAGAQAGDASGSAGPQIEGTLHTIDGTLHFLSATAAAHLLALADAYELVWASGWEEKAEEHLPRLLGLPARLPFLRFPRLLDGRRGAYAHWKLESIDAYAGQRPLAWIDDAFNDACHEWAAARGAPTLLVKTEPAHGLTAREAGLLRDWARRLSSQPGASEQPGSAPPLAP